MRLSPYCLLVVKQDGDIIEPQWDDLGLLAQAPALAEHVHRLLDQLDPQSDVQHRRLDDIDIEWWRLRDTVAVARFSYGGYRKHTLLLLNGADREAEDAACEACRGVIRVARPRVNFGRLVQSVRSAPRPLLVSVGNSGWGTGDWSFCPTEGVLAAAYFHRSSGPTVSATRPAG